MNDFSLACWRKSSYSNSSANCVEVAVAAGPGAAGAARRPVVGVRDSKAGGNSPVLEFGAAAWTRFLAQLKNDHPAR